MEWDFGPGPSSVEGVGTVEEKEENCGIVCADSGHITLKFFYIFQGYLAFYV